MEFSLPLKSKINVPVTLEIIQFSDALNMNIIVTNLGFDYYLRFKGKNFLIVVSFPSEISSTVNVNIPTNASEGFEYFATMQITNFLSLNDNLAPFYKLAEEDPVMKPILKLFKGVHQIKFQTPFTAAAWAIMSQRDQHSTSIKFMKELLVNNAYPTPEDILNHSQDQLEKVVHMARRAQSLLNVAQDFAPSYYQDLNLFENMETKDIYDHLTSISGVGEWSARFTLLRGLGRNNILPTRQNFSRRFVQNNYGKNQWENMYDYYGNYRGYWMLYQMYNAQYHNAV